MKAIGEVRDPPTREDGRRIARIRVCRDRKSSIQQALRRCTINRRYATCRSRMKIAMKTIVLVIAVADDEIEAAGA
jgi:hypothetical protein